MARKKKQPEKDPIRVTEDYYKLHRKAVEDLATANAENTPVYSEEELNKYRHKSKISLPDWLKMVLIKMWFAGAVCFFIFWGFGNYIHDQLDMLVAFGVVLGVCTDLLTNNVLRFMAKTEGQNDCFMMFPQKSYSSFPLNLLYAILLLACVFTLYNVINVVLISATGAKDTVPLGVGPILFGVFYTGFDFLFIGMKRLIKSIVADAKRTANGRKDETL